MHYYIQVLKNYVTFSGRARRSEYWYFVLFNLIASVVLGVLDAIMQVAGGVGFLGLLYTLAVLLPTIAVGVRRMHDIGKSGWWLLLPIIPLVGLIVMIVFLVKDSVPGENQYGPNPKEDLIAATA